MRIRPRTIRKMASSANIPEQTGAGELSGTMTISGQVDQGASANKGMRLEMSLAGDYADVILEGDTDVIYNGGPAALDIPALTAGPQIPGPEPPVSTTGSR